VHIASYSQRQSGWASAAKHAELLGGVVSKNLLSRVLLRWSTKDVYLESVRGRFTGFVHRRKVLYTLKFLPIGFYNLNSNLNWELK